MGFKPEQVITTTSISEHQANILTLEG